MSETSLPMWLLRVQKEGTDLTESEAARSLGKSLETVRTQTKLARARLRARTNAQAVAIAVSLDLI